MPSSSPILYFGIANHRRNYSPLRLYGCRLSKYGNKFADDIDRLRSGVKEANATLCTFGK